MINYLWEAGNSYPTLNQVEGNKWYLIRANTTKFKYYEYDMLLCHLDDDSQWAFVISKDFSFVLSDKELIKYEVLVECSPKISLDIGATGSMINSDRPKAIYDIVDKS